MGDKQLYLFITFENSFTVFSVEIVLPEDWNFDALVLERTLDRLIVANEYNNGGVELTGSQNYLLTKTQNFD